LTTQSLAPDVFESGVWPKLITPSVVELDRVSIPGPGDTPVPLLYDRTNATHLSDEGTKVVCRLLRVTGVEDGTPLLLTEEDGTRPQEIRR